MKAKIEKTHEIAKAYAYAAKALEQTDDIMNEKESKITLEFPLTKVLKISNVVDKD